MWLYLRLSGVDRKGIIVISGDRIFHSSIYQALKEVNELALVVIGPREYSSVLRDSVVLEKNRVLSIGGNSLYVSGGILYIPPDEVSSFLDSVEKVITDKEGIKRWYLVGINEMIKKGKRVRALIFPSDFCVNINRPADLIDPRLKAILKGGVE